MLYTRFIMDAPLVRYVTTVDGVSIAYWKLGSGPLTVHLPALPHSHIHMEWEIPEWRRGYELEATARSLVRYDGRGTGLSQREVDDFSLEAMILDLDAVVRDLDVNQVTLSAAINTCPVAIRYATQFPERVSGLVMWCPVVDASVHRDNSMLAAARKVMETDWEMFSETVAHSLFGWSESEASRRFAALIRAGITQETALRLVPALHTFNVWDDLPHIQCPTLILHRPEMSLLPPGTAERVAARIPNAQLALFEGSSSAPFLGDWRAIVRTVSSFLGVTELEQASAGGNRSIRLLSMKQDGLSPRELEIVELVVGGLTNRQIANRLYIAEKTVENHMGRILVKFDLHTRTELAVYAMEHNLLDESA